MTPFIEMTMQLGKNTNVVGGQSDSPTAKSYVHEDTTLEERRVMFNSNTHQSERYPQRRWPTNPPTRSIRGRRGTQSRTKSLRERDQKPTETDLLVSALNSRLLQRNEPTQ